MGTRAMLIPKLKAARSMLSRSLELVWIGTFVGNRAFMNV